MDRREVKELLDDPFLPEGIAARAYRDLARTHRWLGNTDAILRLLRVEPGRVQSVLDIGCGHGALLQEIRLALGVRVIGFDLRPAPACAPVRILTGDAVVDPLPKADVALAICLAHHLSEPEIRGLIRNVARSCRRLILLDLVRHRLPLVLFRIFATPVLHRINVRDGLTSIRRSYTSSELGRIVRESVEGSRARVVHTVAPFHTRQVLDIAW